MKWKQFSVLAVFLSALLVSGMARATLPDNPDVRFIAPVCELSAERAQLRDTETRVLRQKFQLAIAGALTEPEMFLNTVQDIRVAVAEMRRNYGAACVTIRTLGLPISLR